MENAKGQLREIQLALKHCDLDYEEILEDYREHIRKLHKHIRESNEQACSQYGIKKTTRSLPEKK